MGILTKFFNKKNNGLNSRVEKKNRDITKSNKGLIISKENLNIHPDIKELIWIEDGPIKNYIPEKNEQIYEIDGVKFICSFQGMSEPSLISLKLTVDFSADINTIERPQYFPSYKGLSDSQKGIYWRLLENPYNENIDIGFVFILYYGLERHLLGGQYEKAFNVILKMRHIYQNKSFQNYSGNALILTCLLKQRADLVYEFMKSLNNEFEYQFSDNLFILCKYSLNIPLTTKDIMRMAKSFEFTKLNYIKAYPDIFEETLKENMKNKYSIDEININKFITNTAMKKIRKVEVPIYANVSIMNKEIEVPLLIENFKFKKEIYDLLDMTHEMVKEKLRILRKNGKLQNKTEAPKAKNIILEFDKVEEKRVLSELKASNNNLLDKHFALIIIQDFYYKYRELDSKYLDECIKYCELDINLLNDIEYFDGNIPAFKRLAIIYEKKKNYVEGISVCNKAIKYYENMKMIDEVNEFINRKEKLVNKSNKTINK